VKKESFLRKEKRSLSKKINEVLKEKYNDFVKDDKKVLFNKNYARSSSRNTNDLQGQKSTVNALTIKNELNKISQNVNTKLKIFEDNKINIQIEVQNNLKKTSHSMSKIKISQNKGKK
jgi:hypothetical protein